MKKIALLGAGNLGIAIIEGLLASRHLPAASITATRHRTTLLKSLKDRGVTVTEDNMAAAKNADIIILGVKPFKVEEVLQEIRSVLDPDRHVLISVATGVSLAQLKKSAGADIPTFRAMPNTAIATRESLTCICTDEKGRKHQTVVKELWSVLGEVVEVNEELMEAATVLGACGIAFVFRFIRAMVQGGIEIGFDATTASKIVNQTVKGAVELLMKNGLHPEEEIDKVTTPKGCTITGLNEMEHQGFSSSLIKGILSSYQKIA